MSGFRLDWASHAAARYACEAWHYSGRIPPGTAVRIGVWEHARFIGVVVFSRGPSSHLGSAVGLGVTQVCELSRIALDIHETPVTQIVSPALRMLREHCPGLRLVVSFADPAQGHVGKIYQAGNWLYLGRSAPSSAFVDPEGRVRHDRSISTSGFTSMFGETRLVPPRETCTEIKLPGKLRYAMPLDKAMRRRLRLLSLPYPESVAALDEVE
jgi:hypothetical protein